MAAKTKRITYHGPHRAVIAADGQECERGGSIVVDAALADALLDQPDNWTAAKAKPTPTTDEEGAD